MADLSDILRETTEAMACFASVDMDLWNRHSNACLQAAAALAEQTQQAVEVRALEWADLLSPREDGPAEPTGDIEAATLIGEYSVCLDEDEGVSETPWCAWSPVENIGHFESLEAAKAAAQADYEQRIRSALVDVPAVEPEQRKFKLGDRVAKTKGSSWNGRVVGFYSTAMTQVGYAVESEREPGSVQIYPESALAATRSGSATVSTGTVPTSRNALDKERG